MVTIRFFKAHGFWKKNVLVSFSQSLNRTYNVHSPTTLFPFLYHTPVSLFSLSLFIWSLFLFTFKISISLPSLFLFLVVTRHLDFLKHFMAESTFFLAIAQSTPSVFFAKTSLRQSRKKGSRCTFSKDLTE